MTLQENQRKLHEFNISIRQLLEQAELRIPRINEIIEQVATVGLVTDLVLMGGLVAELPYSATNGPHDSGQVLQAALMVPGGLGLVIWDTEVLFAYRNSPELPASDVRVRFLRFNDMLPAQKSLVMLHAGPLLERLCRIILPAAGIETLQSGGRDRCHDFDDMT